MSVCAACGKEATMQCPKCLAMDLEPTHYCSQECFKGAWGVHKTKHVLPPNPTLKQQIAAFVPPPNDNYTGKLRPWFVTPQRDFSQYTEIEKPDYWKTSEPVSESDYRTNQNIAQYSKEEVAQLREACRLAREIMDIGARMIRPGVTPDEIDAAVHQAHIDRGCYPSPLNYRGFPKSCCTSVNEVICHGVPDTRPLQEGDIIKLDISTFHKGWHADLCETYPVGTIDEESKKLIQATHDSLWSAIAECKPGVAYREIGENISKSLKNTKFSIVRHYCGHGIGRLFHCAPNVPHYARNKAAGSMKPGHTFTIEPMVNGSPAWGVAHWDKFYDGWVAVTEDGARSAQFEHTMVITENGVEVLTARTEHSVPLGINEDLAHNMIAKNFKY